MFQSIVIGNLGGDALVKGEQGREFVTFRVAHNEKYTDSEGVVHESVLWIDCVMNGRPNVLPFLKAGQLVMVMGSASVRVYDSAKDHCKKAGVQVNVMRLELLGGASDSVPSKLYDKDGVSHPVRKMYYTDVTGTLLLSQRNDKFVVDDNGWCVPLSQAPEEVQAKFNQQK